MNKIIAGLFFLAVMAQSIPASEIKAMLGMNRSNYLFSEEIDSLTPEKRTGLAAGLGWSLAIKNNLHFEVDLLYNKYGANVTLPYGVDQSIAGVYENTAIALPLLLKYRFNEKASPYAGLGPELVFIVSHHLKIPDSREDFDLRDTTKKSILAWNAVLGYEFPFDQWAIFAEVRYNRWLGDFWLDAEAQAKSESFAFLLGGAYYLR